MSLLRVDFTPEDSACLNYRVVFTHAAGAKEQRAGRLLGCLSKIPKTVTMS